jgi:hypothetical protein
MGIFDFFKNKEEKNSAVPANNTTQFGRILQQIIKESFDKVDYYALPSITTLDSFKALLKNEEGFIKEFLLFAAGEISSHKEKWRKEVDRTHIYTTGSWEVLIKLITQLLKSNIALSDEELKSVINDLLKTRDDKFSRVELPYTAIFDRIGDHIARDGLSPGLKKILNHLYQENQYNYPQVARMNERIDVLLQGTPELCFDIFDQLGTTLKTFIDDEADEFKRKSWLKIFNACKSAAKKPAPSQKWIAEMKGYLDEIGPETFAAHLMNWIGLVKEIIREIHKAGRLRFNFLRDANHDLLRGLIWAGGLTNKQELTNTLDDYAAWAFKKLPGVGPVSAKTGTACIYAFSLLPFKQGIAKIAKFKLKINNNTILKSIDRVIKDVAEKNGFTEELVMELGIPDFGIDYDGVLRFPFGDYVAIYSIKGTNDAELSWESNGKNQKSVPAVVKNEKSEELRKLKSLIKEIDSLLPVQKDRIEQFYLQQKTWDFAQWKENYLDHPLVSIIAKKLIWHFAGTTNKTEGIFLNGSIIDVDGKAIDWIKDDTKVQLWHPIGFSAPSIAKWRDFLLRNEITQPFKQAHREIYVITDAELTTNTYSNRFAAHILRQHQFAALSKQRGWKYSLMGGFDSHNTPNRDLPLWNIRVEFLVDADWQGEMTESAIFLHIATDQVRFSRGHEVLQMIDVPALVFTEIMRDIDLFVGVASIGNDPGWQDSGDARMDTYWRNYSFGDLTESAKMRSEVLKNLIPRLKIADVCGFDGKYLLVKGKLRDYKIHMGSGNILMSPNDQYLCIVPAPAKESRDKVFLPFEGDQLLSVILSKALLLADDDKIKDQTITRQIMSK